MQGNWKVTVKSKNAAFPQRFVVQGATTGNGTHAGIAGSSVFVTGTQWSIAIQNDPGTGWQSSKTKLNFPVQTGGNYEFDINSDDGGGSDADFNDLILTCSAPVNINDFIIYGNVSLYSGRCVFNPCRKFPYVIDTRPGLEKALKNPLIRDFIEKYYPERIPVKVNPNPPDPEPFFRPLVFDLGGQATQPRTTLNFAPKAVQEVKSKSAKASAGSSPFAAANFDVISSPNVNLFDKARYIPADQIELVKNIDSLFNSCSSGAGSNLTLTFEEYDRTSAELSGSAYTGAGNRRLLGDTITDMNGNYIFRFSFDMTFPGLEDSSDLASGENVNVVMYPDVIVKIVEYSPFTVRYESAPYYNIPNLKRINLCLPKSTVQVSSACFNGNLIGSLGNVFIGGNQNVGALTNTASLRRYGANFLEASGKISVRSPLALFSVDCAAWGGTIDMRGCMYDAAKSAAANTIRWYTIRIWREGTSGFDYVSQNYKHPKFSNRNLPNYFGDNVGPFYPNAGGVLNGTVPAYINIQREIFAEGIDWEFAHFERFMQLNTALYDVVNGVRTPGRFLVQVDGYSETGQLVAGATDLIPLFIHNNGLNFGMTTPVLDDSAIVDAGCGLFRLTDAQMKTPVKFRFRANDLFGFVDNYVLSMNRCPGTALDLKANIEIDLPSNTDGHFTITGSHTFSGGTDTSNTPHDCLGYTGTEDDYGNADLVDVVIEPTPAGEGWIKPGEYFTNYTFGLTAQQRVTNGYNTGLSGVYQAYGQILMERLNP